MKATHPLDQGEQRSASQPVEPVGPSKRPAIDRITGLFTSADRYGVGGPEHNGSQIPANVPV